MKGLEKITDRIRQDARSEIRAICDEGGARAAEIAASYQAQAQQMLSQERERTARAVESMLQRGERGDVMEQSKALLGVKQECLDEAFRLAGQKLRSLPRDEYAGVLAKIAAAAGSGDEEVILSAEDAADIGAAVVQRANELKEGAAFALSGETRPLEGGLVLKRGAVEINCTFVTQLRLLRQTMAADVAAILFS